MARLTQADLDAQLLTVTATFPRMRILDTATLKPMRDYSFVRDGIAPGTILRFMVGPWPGYIRVFSAGNIVYYKNPDMHYPLFVASQSVEAEFAPLQEREDFVDILFSTPLHPALRMQLDADHTWDSYRAELPEPSKSWADYKKDFEK